MTQPSVIYNPFTPEQTAGGARQQETIIARLIGRSFTNTVVKVVAVEAGATGAVGFVDVVNLVQQLDANNRGIPNTTMYKLPYFRLQGGLNAVIIDPKEGDIGLAAFAMRDITHVKDTKKEGKPRSRREYDVSDGLYIGGFLNGSPKQYIEFLEDGINITSTGDVNITSTGDTNISCISANVEASAELSVNAPISQFTGNVMVAGFVMAAGGIGSGSAAPAAGNIIADGDILTTGSISDGVGSMDDIREIYDQHTHKDGQSIETTPPDPLMDG